MEQGFNTGMEQGESRKEIEIAKTGLQNNVPLETISTMTSLSTPEIEKLKTEMADS